MAKGIRAGQLDRRVEIQESTETRTSRGSVAETWTTVARVWAGISFPSSGNSEGVEADQVVSTTRVAFTIRYRDGITEKMRIVYGNENYAIIPPIEEHGRKQFLILRAEKQV